MKALIIIGIILSALILLTVLVMIIPVKFGIRYADGNLFWFVKILFFSMNSEKASKQKKPKKEKKQKDKKEEDKPEKKKSKKTSVSSIYEAVRSVMSILGTVISKAVQTAKHIVVYRFRLKLVCAGDDAADVGMSYGTCCASIYPVLGFIEANTNIKDRNQSVDVRCDFDSDSAVFETDIAAKIRIFYIVTAGMSMAKDFIVSYYNTKKRK